MKALITTAAIILTTTFATADKPDWVKKLQAEANASKVHSDEFDYDRYDPEVMEPVSYDKENRVSIFEEADQPKFDSAKGNNLLITRGSTAIIVQSYGYTLNVFSCYTMNSMGEYVFDGDVHTKIPAKDVQKVAIEFMMKGMKAFKAKHSIVK